MAKHSTHATVTPAASDLVLGLQGGTANKNYTAQALADLFKGTKGSDIASAATTNLGAATGVYVHVTGTTTITALGTVAAGTFRLVRFAGVLTLTHNATSLILPTGANITTAADDTAAFVSEGSGNWRCLWYQRKNGEALAGGGGGGGSGLDLPIFDITDYGAAVDGSTDDTTAVQAAINAAGSAGGGIVFFPQGTTVINGALSSSVQLSLPAVAYPGGEQVTIWLRGCNPPGAGISVIGSQPAPDNYSVIKGTLNTGSGALIGDASGFTNIHLKVENLTFRMPANPVLTACDFRYVGALDMDNVIIDTGDYNVSGLTQPTTADSCGLRTPENGNGAFTRLGAVNVVGFYNGFQFFEHTVGQQLAAWGCNRAFLFSTSNHASHFQRLMAVHCPRGIVGLGTHYVDVEQFNIEHAASGWWAPVYDIDDGSHYLQGKCRWHVVLAGTGPDSTFLVNGANSFARQKIGYADDAFYVVIEAPSNKTYPLVLKAPRPGKIVEVTSKSASGTCTATVKINTTALGGTANSVSSTESSQTHSSSNVFAAGDDINLTISSNSSCADMALTIRYLPL